MNGTKISQKMFFGNHSLLPLLFPPTYVTVQSRLILLIFQAIQPIETSFDIAYFITLYITHHKRFPC